MKKKQKHTCNITIESKMVTYINIDIINKYKLKKNENKVRKHEYKNI